MNKRSILLFGLLGFSCHFTCMGSEPFPLPRIRTEPLSQEPLIMPANPAPEAVPARPPVVLKDLGITLRWIPPGRCLMGSRKFGNPHIVTLTTGFWLGTTEVTQSQWTAIMGRNPSYRTGDTKPVEQVSWQDCADFCAKLTDRERTAGRLPEGYYYTLPTEAQWEHAARGGDISQDPETEGSFARAWTSENATETQAVGLKSPNIWGLYDMRGNVWEWCQDHFIPYTSEPKTDPRNSDISYTTGKEVRGGSFMRSVDYADFSARSHDPKIPFACDVGFRLAVSSTPPGAPAIVRASPPPSSPPPSSAPTPTPTPTPAVIVATFSNVRTVKPLDPSAPKTTGSVMGISISSARVGVLLSKTNLTGPFEKELLNDLDKQFSDRYHLVNAFGCGLTPPSDTMRKLCALAQSKEVDSILWVGDFSEFIDEVALKTLGAVLEDTKVQLYVRSVSDRSIKDNTAYQNNRYKAGKQLEEIVKKSGGKVKTGS